MSTGEFIKTKREEKGLTQTQLAQSVGVSEPMICQIERGSKPCPLALAKLLAKELDFNLNEL